MADADYSCDERQEQRRNVSHFAALIATPASGAFTMPANARLSFVSTAGAVTGATLATLVGVATRTIKSKGLIAGGRQVLDYVERAVVITPSAGINVYVDRGLTRWSKIAGG